jgi:RsiW-degrading membrane proteinase PrsW (M82 family)
MFWLREDPHPEPKNLLVKAFFAGMLAVPFAIIAELIIINAFGFNDISEIFSIGNTYLLIAVMSLWAVAEEVFKFIFCIPEIARKDDNEPIDAVIYLIVAALGFAALENVLFIIAPLFAGDAVHVAAATNMRFIGATLLHVLASGIVGLGLGYAFYKSRISKVIVAILSLCGAILLHACFNLSIILYESHIFLSFAVLWMLVIGLIFAIERLKNIKKTKTITP